jgi:hypothetical protein
VHEAGWQRGAVCDRAIAPACAPVLDPAGRHEILQDEGSAGTAFATSSPEAHSKVIRPPERIGRGGDTSRLLLDRFPTDVLALKPAWCLLAVGVVDVRRAFQPERAGEAVLLDECRSNLRMMTNELRAAGGQVLLLEPIGHARPPVGAPAGVTVTPVNSLTATYVAAMKQVAKECGVD